MGLKEYQVVGRHAPTENDPNPKLYRMLIFAKDEVIAKSRFWYFLRYVKVYFVYPVLPMSRHNLFLHLLIIHVRFLDNLKKRRRPAVKSWLSMLFMRNVPYVSRTLAYGCVTIRVRGRTTCTRYFLLHLSDDIEF